MKRGVDDDVAGDGSTSPNLDDAPLLERPAADARTRDVVDDDDDDDGRSIDDLRRENADLRRANAALEEELRSLREAARSPSILERFVEEAPDVFAAHVLPRFDNYGDLAVLAMVNRQMRGVVFELPVGDVRWTGAAVSRQLAKVRNFVGSIRRLAWAWERGCPWNAKTFACIAKGGNLQVAKWAKERGCQWDERTCAEAAGEGHLEVLQWL